MCGTCSCKAAAQTGWRPPGAWHMTACSAEVTLCKHCWPYMSRYLSLMRSVVLRSKLPCCSPGHAQASDYATAFHQTYYLHLMREIFAVVTGAPSRLAALVERVDLPAVFMCLDAACAADRGIARLCEVSSWTVYSSACASVVLRCCKCAA